MLLRVVLGDRTPGGLDVDDHQPALRIALQAVDASADPHARQTVGRFGEDAVEFNLGADLGELVAGRRAPGDERGQHRAMAVEFVGGIPR